MSTAIQNEPKRKTHTFLTQDAQT